MSLNNIKIPHLPRLLGLSGMFVSMVGVSNLPAAQVVMLDATIVTGESEAAAIDQRGWLPPVQGAAIFAGMKTGVIDQDGQALSQTPSLLLAEESSPLVSIGYRGLGTHRAQFMQVLMNGIPIHADQFGYPVADDTAGKLGNYLYWNHRESDGSRSKNSEYDLDERNFYAGASFEF